MCTSVCGIMSPWRLGSDLTWPTSCFLSDSRRTPCRETTWFVLCRTYISWTNDIFIIPEQAYKSGLIWHLTWYFWYSGPDLVPIPNPQITLTFQEHRITHNHKFIYTFCFFPQVNEWVLLLVVMILPTSFLLHFAILSSVIGIFLLSSLIAWPIKPRLDPPLKTPWP